MFRQIISIALSALAVCTVQLNASEIEKKDYFKIGGAFRFNTAFQNYETSHNTLDSYLTMDAWYLSVDTRKKGFDLSAQYRFYPDSKTHFLHHAYIAYDITKGLYIKGGVFQKPFGAADFASHSWWFQAPYYVGLEDGNGIGLGLTYNYKNFIFDLAYYRQATPNGSTSSSTQYTPVGTGRYAYAIVGSDKANIRELDNFNARLRYQLTKHVELGVSAQLGTIYNREIDDRKISAAGAVHVDIDCKRWNFKGEVVGYHYNTRDNEGNKMDIVPMGAYAAITDVAAKAMIYVAGLSYDIPINRKFIQSIRTYIDYSIVKKFKSSFRSTQILIPGMMAGSGPIYTYVDCAFGKNHPSITAFYGEGPGEGKANRWNMRLNINMGYYF